MIQLNLLPDVKLLYIKAQRSRRLIFSVSVLVSGVSVGLLVLLLSLGGLQKKHLSDLSRDITRETSELQHKPNIGQILTVQNQLQSLTGLHSAKPAASHLFEYLNSVTPAQVDITTFSIDFAAQTASITGTSDALSSVNKYVDTLKFTAFTSDKVTASTPAFSNVVLTSFGLTTEQQGKSVQANQAASYTISLAYDKSIFDITQKVNLSVPKQITTRSEVQQPSDLFQKAPVTTKGGNQ